MCTRRICTKKSVIPLIKIRFEREAEEGEILVIANDV